jgi:glycosyltransferase involved in cell wall biosynthesis
MLTDYFSSGEDKAGQFIRGIRNPNTMKILYIVPFVPRQVKVRSFNLIPRLARRHQIHLVCVSSEAPSKMQRRYLEQHCQTLTCISHSLWRAISQCAAALPTKTPMRIAYCESKAASKAVDDLLNEVEPDVIYVERWRALQYVPRDAVVPVICDPTDSMTLYNRRLSKTGAWWERFVGWEEHRRFSRYEGALARRAAVSVFCSQVDMECVKEQAPEVRYELMPNGVDCKKYFFKEANEEEPATVVFTGNLKYRPNRHAAEFFLAKIFPLVQKQVPQAKFVAVGSEADNALERYRSMPGFEAVGFVSELRPYLAKATVAVAPLTVGAGVSNKLGEGFAVGTPVVATPLACGDLPVKDGEHLLIARDASQFADRVVEMLKDERLRRAIALRARRLVQEQYDWEIVSRKMESLMCELAAFKSGVPLAEAETPA